MTGRVRTAVTMGLREFRRTPVLLGLLMVLPVYYIGAFTYIVPEATLPIAFGSETVRVSLRDFVVVLMTPLTAGMLCGIVGLFLMESSKAADDRLRLAGFRSRELIASRVVLLAVGGALVSGATLAVLLVGFSPESIPAFVLATVLAALTYGVIGVLVGVSLDRLPGVYVMLFAPIIDILMFQNPMASDSPRWVKLLPGYFVTKATTDAAFTATVDAGNLIGATAYLVVLLVVGTVVFYRATAIN